jgi:DNA-binding transcriptional MerR regulator
MPISRPAINAFTPKTASAIVGMSVHMLNYLAREGYLLPTYPQSRRHKPARGRPRYYSYRDLVIAKIVQRLLDGGLELSRLKEGIRKLGRSPAWQPVNQQKTLRSLATDGQNLYLLDEQGRLTDLNRNGQFAFFFVLDVASAQDEVRRKLGKEQLESFTLENRPIRFAARA